MHKKIITLEVMWGRVENFFLLLCISLSLLGDFVPRPLPFFLSLMKEKKAKENQGGDRRQVFRVLRMMRSRGEKFFADTRMINGSTKNFSPLHE